MAPVGPPTKKHLCDWHLARCMAYTTLACCSSSDFLHRLAEPTTSSIPFILKTCLTNMILSVFWCRTNLNLLVPAFRLLRPTTFLLSSVLHLLWPSHEPARQKLRVKPLTLRQWKTQDLLHEASRLDTKCLPGVRHWHIDNAPHTDLQRSAAWLATHTDKNSLEPHVECLHFSNISGPKRVCLAHIMLACRHGWSIPCGCERRHV